MYRSVYGKVPDGYKLSFESIIYNSFEHRKLQSFHHWHSYYFLNDQTREVLASLFLHVEGGIAQSPFKAPYGAIDYCDRLTESDIQSFIDFIHEHIKTLGVGYIKIKLPGRLSISFDLQENCFLKKGYQIERYDSGAWLLVSSNFEGKLEPEKRRKFRHQTHIKSDQRPLSELPYVYQFIYQCRLRKGYQLSLSLQEVEQLANQFPNDIILFTTTVYEKMIAAAICVRVDSQMLYTFYYDHLADYDPLSPIIGLMATIHSYCLKNSIGIIDLGTAMKEGKVNEGLLNFKLSLGALPTIKNTLGFQFR